MTHIYFDEETREFSSVELTEAERAARKRRMKKIAAIGAAGALTAAGVGAGLYFNKSAKGREQWQKIKDSKVAHKVAGMFKRKAKAQAGA